MTKVIGKKPLFSTDLKYFKALQIIDGKTLFERYASSENVVKKHIDPKYQDFISYPVQDGNKITFHGKKYNETPRIFSDLQGEDLAHYQNIKAETLTHYNQVMDSLKNSGKTTEVEFLADAIKYVDDRLVYCYDNYVVLGVWGMQMRNNLKEDIYEICKPWITKKEKTPSEPEPSEPEPSEPEPSEPEPKHFTVTYLAGENGILEGNSSIRKPLDSVLSDDDIPPIDPNEGYEFVGWDENPNGYKVIDDKEFTAQYRPITVPPEIIDPWYRRFLPWFTGKGCLKWLLWLLLLLLLLLLLSWLLHCCDGSCGDDQPAPPIPYPIENKPWIKDDPRVGDSGGIYNPGNPYTPVPTPPGYEDVLPPEQGVLPPAEDDLHIIPGNPTIIGNRLNILMENEDKSIMELAKDFKTKYPDDTYKVVYYDDVVKRMQIQIPSAEREQLKQEIPPAFTPEYELFVFDEALFEGNYTPNDPAFSNGDKSWYLNAIHAPQAWEITRGSPKLTIAIVDNGFNLSHPELKNKVVMPYNVWKHSTDVFPQEVDHGTHVAGTALAIADNGKGLCGIAPDCAFMPIQVADKKGLMTTTSVLDGILYALYQGADVINVSLGSQFTGLSQFPESAQQDLIHNHFKEEERLWREIMRIAANFNSTIVVAAGNDNVLAGIDALQRPELIVTVSAVDKNNRNISKADFSNYGSYSTLSAPGVGIYSAFGKNGYQVLDGTSMAAPIVAGGIALMKSLNNSLTTKQMICILQTTGLETQGNIGKLIQLDKALAFIQSGDTVDCTPAPSTGDVQVLLSWDNYNDLDLICTDPYGELIFFRNRSVSSGGQLEIDMNVEYPDSKTPIENIYWPAGSAPNGTYAVHLLYYKCHEPAIDETSYHIKVKYGGKIKDYSGAIKKADRLIPVCSFTLGTATNNPANSNKPPVNDHRSQLEQERDRLQRELDRVNNELQRMENNK
jgi:subtilisin family serine protease